MPNKDFSILIVYMLVLIVMPIATVFALWYSNNVYGNKAEVHINTMYKQGRTVLGQFTAKLAELAQVRVMSVDDRVRIINVVFGEGGRAANQAAWQWVQEQNPKADTAIHNKIDDVINASRDKFMNHQQSLLAICHPYQTRLDHPIHFSRHRPLEQNAQQRGPCRAPRRLVRVARGLSVTNLVRVKLGGHNSHG